MLAGSINNLEDCSFYPKALQKAIEYLKDNAPDKMELGSKNIGNDGMKVTVMDFSTKPREECLPEVHGQFIDVQYLIFGEEQIGYYPEDGKNEIHQDSMKEKDIILYKNNPYRAETRINMVEGMYAIFFPWDVHVPAIAVNKVAKGRKAVIKVPLKLIVK